MTSKTLHEYMQDGDYLPDFMKDFHDQKDIFKRVNDIVYNAKEREGGAHEGREFPNWTASHIYTVDFFLWYLGRHGYKLQKTRSNVEFKDLYEDLSNWKRERMEAMFAEFEAMRNKSEGVS